MEKAMAEPMGDDAMADLLEQYGNAMEEFEHRGGYDLESRAQAVLTGLGIGPGDYNRPVESFSGGWKMRIALARILTVQPDVLLLDEPTNHLDVESIVWLENWLANDFKGAVLMTCHDHDFMNRLVTRTVEVANRTATVYGGNYDFYIREREIRREQLLASYRRQQEMLAKEKEFIARFAAREVLLEALKSFTGTVVIVSHDRHFLRSLVSRVFAIDHGEMVPYEGDYAYYQSKIREQG